MAGSSSMAGSDSGGLDGCKVYSGVPQYGSRLSLETFLRVLPGDGGFIRYADTH